ncbi:Ig-like domain-containing protein, partial [Brucella cytisi]
VNGDGSYSFVPAPDYTGAIPVITYTVSDGAGGTDTSTLTLTMVPVNDPPVASNDVGVTPEDTPLTGNVLTNDTDIDGGVLRVAQFTIDGRTFNPGESATIAGTGTLTINLNGSYTFVPAPNYNGPVPVATYTVSDGRGGTDTASLIIIVSPVNDPPQSEDIPDQISVDATSVAPVDVSRYFLDVDGDVLTYSASGLPDGLSIDPVTGIISGVLPNDASRQSPYTITITATDPGGLSTTETFHWTVVNPAPVASDDAASGPEDANITGTVIANDRDPDGDDLRITAFEIGGISYTVGQTAVLSGIGTLVINADGRYTFRPALNFHGAVPTITYTLSDADGGTDTARLTLNVTPVNDPPILIDDYANGNEDTTITGNVLSNDSDPDGDTLVVTGFSVDGNPTAYQPGDTATIAGVGSITIELNGEFTFVPVSNYDGDVPNILYTAADGNGGTGYARLIITINPVDDYVPVPDDNIPDLPSGPDIDYDPENVDGAVVEAVRGLDGLNDIADLYDQPIDAAVKAQFDAPLKFSFNTFLGGSSAIVVDRPGGGVERIQFEVIKHRDVIYLQIVDQTKINEQSSDLNYRIGGVDGALPPAWLKQIGSHTFAGVPDAQTGTVNLMILIIHKDEQVAEREIQLDSVNGLLVLPTEPEDHGFEGVLAPTFAQQMLDGPETQDLSELERALGFR